MSDFLLQFGLSNGCFSLLLAIVALVVGAKGRRPQLAYMLWLLVFVKLLTPPLVMVPIVTIHEQPESVAATIDGSFQGDMAHITLPGAGERKENTLSFAGIRLQALHYGRLLMPPIWLVGSVLVLAWSLVRVWRFGRLLVADSEAASPELYAATAKVARRLGLKKTPMIQTTTAALSPMVWWAGGKVKVIVPLNLLDQMNGQQQELILAHELAHVRRRDHLVRWIEWLACVCFWWNPIIWWAQRNLRAAEEICCDELVVSRLKSEPKYYANTLLSIVEFLAHPAIRPPAVASEINSGGALERRFKMIVSENGKNNNTRWMQVCVLLLAVVVLPLSMAYAKDAGGKTEAYLEQVNNKLNAAVEAGKMTEEEAAAKIEAIEEELAKKAEVDAYFGKVWANLQVQVEAGVLTAEDAEIMMAAVKKKHDKQTKRDKYEAVVEKIKAAVDAGEITESEARAKMAAVRKKMFDKDKKDVDWGAIKQRIEGAVERGDLTREEADAKYAEIKKRMAHGDKDHPADMGERIRHHLAENGFTEEQIEQTMGALRRVVHEMKSEGEDYELDPKMREYFENEVGLTDDRIELIQGLARRILYSHKEAKDRHTDVDWDAIKQRIEGAVERGDMTREEADAKYTAIKKRLGPWRQGQT